MAAYCMRRFQKSAKSRRFPYWLWFKSRCIFYTKPTQCADPSTSSPSVFECFPLVPRGGHEGMQKIRSVIRAKLEACNNAVPHCWALILSIQKLLYWNWPTNPHIPPKQMCSMQPPTEPYQAVGMLRADGKKKATRGPHAAKDIQLALRSDTES